MKRIIPTALIAIAACTLFCCESPKQKTEQTKDAKPKVEQATNELPNMMISLLDGSKIQAKKLEGNTILVLFFPDCDHCQREATEVQERIEKFKNYTMYFLATSPPDQINKFSVDYKLHRYENVKFGLITVEDVLSNFGAIPTPSIYIYSAEHKMIQKFNGETPIDTVLKYIQ